MGMMDEIRKLNTALAVMRHDRESLARCPAPKSEWGEKMDAAYSMVIERLEGSLEVAQQLADDPEVDAWVAAHPVEARQADMQEHDDLTPEGRREAWGDDYNARRRKASCHTAI